MKVLGVFINIMLLVKLLLAERNPAHGLMRVTDNNVTMSKAAYHHRGNKGNRNERPHRIFGRKEVKSIEEFPYMAFMTYWETDKEGNRITIQACGATILDQRHLLTAAHCVTYCSNHNYCKEYDPETYTIYAGSVAAESALNPEKVKTWHIHPEYQFIDRINKCINNYDLAVVELRSPLRFNSEILQVQLFSLPIRSGNFNESNNCKVLGWGYTKIGEPKTNTEAEILQRRLKVAGVNLIDNKQCVNINNFVCQSTQICTKYPRNVAGVCHGDDGGPIICDGVQIGIISWVSDDKCVDPNLLNVYSRVDVNIEWIRRMVPKIKDEAVIYYDSLGR